MDDYDGSRSYGSNNYSSNSNMMQLQTYYGPPHPPRAQDLRCYSSSYAQTQAAAANRDMKLKKGKSMSGSVSNSWSLADPEFQRKKRVASYKMYGVEGKMKGTFRKSLRWIKDRYSQVVYGWW